MLVLGLKGANPLQRDRHVISGIDLGAMRVLVAIAAVSALDAYACAERLEGRTELGLTVRNQGVSGGVCSIEIVYRGVGVARVCRSFEAMSRG